MGKERRPLPLRDILWRLVGPVSPVGDTAVDNERFENLKELTQLVDDLVTEIDRIATEHAGSHEYSRDRAGRHCAEFLDQLGITNEEER